MSILDGLGPRICLMGPSNSGKSTLAHAIARSRGLPAVHLDRLYHRPGTDWEPRPHAEFLHLHEQAIQQPRWIIEGNYTRCIGPRLARATGLILLDLPTAAGLFRYLRRTWFDRHRHGALEGGRDSVKWQMVRHLVVATPANRRRYAAMFDGANLPKVRLATVRELRDFYRVEALER
jgi:adenylate kinase family enzyme